MMIEVVHAGRERLVRKEYRLAAPATVADALAAAGADPEFDGVDLAGAAIGIFGVIVSRERALEEGDRVEIHADLAADPKAARRQRAKAAKGIQRRR